MRFSSVNERVLPIDSARVTEAMASLSSPDDQLWPTARWPRMKLDAGLSPGSTGGHGPIQYVVEAYEPGRQVSFRFLPTSGFGGVHWFESTKTERGVCLRHALLGEASFFGWLYWWVVLGPMHEALVQDAFDRAEALSDATKPAERPLSLYVRGLRAGARWLLTRGARSRS